MFHSFTTEKATCTTRVVLNEDSVLWSKYSQICNHEKTDSGLPFGKLATVRLIIVKTAFTVNVVFYENK